MDNKRALLMAIKIVTTIKNDKLLENKEGPAKIANEVLQGLKDIQEERNKLIEALEDLITYTNKDGDEIMIDKYYELLKQTQEDK